MKKAAKKKVSPIPKGYPVLSPHLSVKGAVQALDFYKKAFGAKERMRVPGPNGTLGHAEIDVNGAVIMFADEYPGGGTGSPSSLNGTSVSLMLYVKDVDAAFTRAIAAGATQIFPPDDKFYGDRCGVLKDPFGHVWCLSTHVEDVSPKEMAKRAETEMAKMMAAKPQA
jgi:PhnB protein